MHIRDLAVTGLVAALLLSGCGGGTPTPSPTTAAAVTQATPTTATAAAATPTTAPAATPTTAPATTPTMASASPSPTAVSQATATSAPAASPTAAQGSGGASIVEDDIRAMASAWAETKSFRMKIEVAQESQTGEFTVEVVRPDRERTQIQFGNQTMEVIRIGQDVYVKIADQWTKTTGAAPQMTFDFNADEVVSEFNAGVQSGDRVTKGNVTTVDGAQCQEWILTSATAEHSGTFCIGVNDQLPRRFQTADGRVTVTFSDWNAPITIEPPM